MSNIHIEYCFHPVGQGTFASGRIKYGSKSFNWVYDCGSTKPSKKYLTPAIDAFDEKSIDILFVSHFDYDHISGLERLLQNRDVRYVVLPYTHLWKRLLLAFENNILQSNPLFRFFKDPRSYIEEKANSVGKFILVQGAADNPNSNQPEEFRQIDLSESSDDVVINLNGRMENGSIILKKGSVIKVSFSKEELWEFLPYNVESPFDEEISEMFTLAADLFREGKVGIDEVKRFFDDIAGLNLMSSGQRSEARNIISMFLWAGPYFRYEDILDSYYQNQKIAILYTGDGYLMTFEQLCDLRQHLKKIRVRMIGCLQVMHHGSRQNCSRHVRELLNPSWAVFCARRVEYGHPHREVEEYFAGCSLLADHQQMVSLTLESNGSELYAMER